jgi:soluble lytic murein transglycosylase-like protein
MAAIGALGLTLAAAHPAPRALDPAGSTPGSPGIDSLRALTERAATLAAAGQHAAAGGLYEEAARVRPDLTDWLRLSALQQAARAGLPAWAQELASDLRRNPAVPPDSVRLELVRAWLLASDSTPAATLATVAEGMDGRWDPELWTTRAAPILLEAGDTAAAVAGYRRALLAAGVSRASGDSLLALDDGWTTLRAVAAAERREGRNRHAAELLARAERAAPPARRPDVALELARVRLEGGLSGVRSAVAPWVRSGAVQDSVRAAMELAVGTYELRRGSGGRADQAFRRAAGAGGEAAARASYLVADLAHDRGHLSTMRTWLERTAERFPRSEYGGLALMRLGFAAFLARDYEGAARRFRSYRVRDRSGSWMSAALYWEGRAREADGDSATAEELYGRISSSDPAGYYGLQASRRLGDPALDGVEADTTSQRTSAWTRRADSLLARMALLRDLGWQSRALLELEAVRPRLVSAGTDRVAMARRLERSGWATPAIGMAWSAFAARNGRWSEGLLRAVFPMPFRDTIVAAAREVRVDPALLAAVVRQESAFDPDVVSSAGAIGLTQLLPSTAQRVARRAGLPVPDSIDLFDPGVNIELGARYLAELLERYDGSRLAALVAYNAGPSRWARWRSLPERTADPELFVEAIPFSETRRYVKAVLRNQLLYRKLHGLEAPRAADAGTARADSMLGAG